MFIRIYKYLYRMFVIKFSPIYYARKIGVKIGSECRLLGLHHGTFGSEPYLIKIGNHVTITNGVNFITHDGGVWVFRKEHPNIDVFGKIEVGDNSFIGINTTILPGVSIGENCVIGAGSVVTKDIPANSIAVGVPAKVISSTTEYKNKVLKKSTNIRSFNPEIKKNYLINKYFSYEVDKDV
jgi:acetyltransferase-like isoleucine patch superfamily enzyme